MKKIKRLWQIKFFKNYFLLIVSFTILEIIFRLIENLLIFSYSGLRIFLGLNILALLLSLILSYFPKLVSKIVSLIIVFIFTIYGIAQLGFNNFLGVYASLQIKTQASAVSSYVWDFIKSFNWYFYLMLIPFVLLLIYYIFIDKKITVDLPKRKINKRIIFINILKYISVILLCFVYYGSLVIGFMQNKLNSSNAYDLFRKPNIPSLSVNEFGYIGFGFLDVKEYFIPGDEITYKVEYNPEDLTSSKPEEKENIAIDNEIWKDIIENEKNNKYNNLNKYFISNDITYTNEYTGLFKDKNLIVIMVESGSNLMLNEEFYPNIAKLYNGGWSWNNYYSPRNSCATGNNEMSGMTGLYTIYNNCTANVYKNNTYFESIFNLFNNKGYYTNSFHNHFDAYYYRTKIHKNMGSSKFYKVQNMKIPYGHSYGDWASDSDMMEFYLEKLEERDKEIPFMSWITTVTSHQPYSNSSIYNDKYFNMFDTSLPKDVRRYMSKLKVVDEAIGILLTGLEEKDLLDDTVIALYCDHYPYAISNANLSKALGYELGVDKNSDQVPFIIYSSELENKVYDEYTTYVNITPTLANLFGLEYDSRLYVGSDILSEDYESLVVFADGSWKNEIAFYNASTSKLKYYTQKTYTEEEILAINEKISLKLKMSSAAIKNNYFNYLNKKLNSYNTSE